LNESDDTPAVFTLPQPDAEGLHLSEAIDSPGMLVGANRDRFHFYLISSLVVLAGVGMVWLLAIQSQRIPQFYAEALQTNLAQAGEDGEEFERKLVQLRNVYRKSQPWSIEITQDQLNGWLISDLPEKFASSLPKGVSDPRVVFAQDEFKLAFKYQLAGITGVVVVTVDIFCTDTPNEIAIKLKSARTGWLPLPIGPWLEKFAEGIHKAGVSVYWSGSDDTPVVVAQIPGSVTRNSNRLVVVDAIDVQADKVIIVGTSTTDREPVPE
jgi:hypothetical protein